MKDWKCIHCGHDLRVDDSVFASGRQDIEQCPGWAKGLHQDEIVHKGKPRPKMAWAGYGFDEAAQLVFKLPKQNWFRPVAWSVAAAAAAGAALYYYL